MPIIVPEIAPVTTPVVVLTETFATVLTNTSTRGRLLRFDVLHIANVTNADEQVSVCYVPEGG